MTETNKLRSLLGWITMGNLLVGLYIFHLTSLWFITPHLLFLLYFPYKRGAFTNPATRWTTLASLLILLIIFGIYAFSM